MNIAVNKELNDITLYSFKAMLIEVEDVFSSLDPKLTLFRSYRFEEINPLGVALASARSYIII